MKLKIILVMAVVATLSLGTWYYFNQNKDLGVSITTIAGTDTIKDSRTTINDNFTALNNGKLDISSTSVSAITTLANLASVGTITTGTWSATAIGATKGGTGLTSFTNGSLLYATAANTWSALASSTYGSYLTINGAGYPSWIAPTAPTSTALYTNTSGLFGIDTTSGQFRYNDGTATRTLVSDRNWKPVIASSTVISFGGTTNATTTIYIPVDARALTIDNIYCYTDTGTSSIRVGDGTNYTEAILCGSVGVSTDDGTITNATFTALEKPRLEFLNNYAGTPNQTPITVRYHYDAD